MAIICNELKCEKNINGECSAEKISIDDEHQCEEYLPSRELLIKELNDARREIRRLKENQTVGQPSGQPRKSPAAIKAELEANKKESEEVVENKPQMPKRPARRMPDADGITVLENS